MRVLTWVVVVAALVWGGWWFAGAQGARAGANALIDQLRADGIEVDHAGLSLQGFPNRFDLTLDRPALRDPAGGFGWSGDFLQVFALSYRPWHVIAALPPEQTITLPGGAQILLATTSMQASVEVVPGPALTLDRAIAEGTDARLQSAAGWAIAWDKAVLASRRDPGLATAQEIGAEVTGLVPDAGLMAALAAAGSDLPPRIDQIRAAALARLSAPLDRHAGQTRPALTALDIREVLLRWGHLTVHATGQLAPDASGLAEGSLTLRITGWRALLPLMQATGAVQPDFLPTAERMLATLTVPSQGTDTIEVPLTFANGMMRMGPLPLGPAPRLAQRQ